MSGSEFEMLIVDVFHFDNEKTVFAGVISGDHSNLIRKTTCSLVINGESKGTVVIEGEMMPLGRRQESSHIRSVSSSGHVNLSSEFVKHNDCRLLMME